MMNTAVFKAIKVSFVLGVISALLSLALYSSLTSPQNSISKKVVEMALEFTEEEEERSVREIPEADLYLDYVATAQLNKKVVSSNFPIHIDLSPQEYFQSFKKPPRLY